MNEKWAFIVNPIAGDGFAGDIADEIPHRCREKKIECEVIFTERKRQASLLARDCADRGFTHVIAVGGDGTINEAAQGVIGHSSVIFGTVAAGTGNDLIQIMGYDDRFTDDDWEILFEGNNTPMDVGYCNGNHFLNGMGLGYDAQVAAANYTEDEAHEVKRGNKTKYVWHIVKTLVFYRSKPMWVDARDERYRTTCFMNTVSIGRRFAGGFFVTPRAWADDGLLDICNVKGIGFFERFWVLSKIPSGTHTEMKSINYYQTHELRLEFDEVVPYHLDGELYFDSKFDIRVLPEALRMIYNPYGDHYFSRVPGNVKRKP